MDNTHSLQSEKHKMEQLLSDTKSIIDSIYQHENTHDGLTTTLTRDLATIESTLCRSNQSSSFDHAPTNDVADLGQKRIESLPSARAQFDSPKQVEAADPWRPDHQQSIQRYFEAAADPTPTRPETLIVDTQNTASANPNPKSVQSDASPSIRHNLAIARNKNLSPSLHATNLAGNTVQTGDDAQLAQLEREMNDIQRSIDVEIPLARYYLKRADFEQGKRDLVDKLNRHLTRKDLRRIFAADQADPRKMDVHEFRQRLAKTDKATALALDNVELTRLDAELKRLNDDVRDEAHFDQATLTRFLSSTGEPEASAVQHGHLTHLDSTLSLYHPSRVQLRSGSDSSLDSLARSAQSEPLERPRTAPMERRHSFRDQLNPRVDFADFTCGGSGESAEEKVARVRKALASAGHSSSEQGRVSRRGQPQHENWWLRQYYMHSKFKQMNARRRRKGMVRGRHSTDSTIELKALPYSLRLQHRSGRRTARKVSLEQYRGESVPAQAHAAGMYARCRTKCIRTQMWSPARSRSFVCRK